MRKPALLVLAAVLAYWLALDAPAEETVVDVPCVGEVTINVGNTARGGGAVASSGCPPLKCDCTCPSLCEWADTNGDGTVGLADQAALYGSPQQQAALTELIGIYFGQTCKENSDE